MKKFLSLAVLLLVFLAGCAAKDTAQPAAPTPPEAAITRPIETEIAETAQAVTAGDDTIQEAEIVQNTLTLTINDTPIPVIWEDNPSVSELKELAGKQPIRIEMQMYGGWEQVGSLGYSISRNDIQLRAGCGDIMLYCGNQLVMFYGENTWAYTKLGHIDLPAEEITAILSGGSVTASLAIQ